jgi:hypothetical protein
MLSTVAIFLASFMVVLCHSAVAQEQLEYFPIQEGDTWTYLHRYRSFADLPMAAGAYGWLGRDAPRTDYLRAEYVTVTVTHFEQVDGVWYAVFWDAFSNGRRFRESEEGNLLELKSGMREWLYDMTGGSEEVSYTFSPGGTRIDAHRSSMTTEVPAGEFACYTYGFSTWWDLGEWWVVRLAVGVGMIYWRMSTDFGDYDELSLVHATVGGVYYGTPTESRSSRWGSIKATFR